MRLDPRWTARLHIFARVAGTLVTLIGGLSILGWTCTIRPLQDLFATGVTMKTNTAIAGTASGLAVLLLNTPHNSRRKIRTILSALAFLIGFLSLMQHVTGRSLGIDTLLFGEAPGEFATISPNRMGPPASIAFSLAGMSLLIWHTANRDRQRVANGLACVIACISSLSVIGYLYGAEPLYGVPKLTGIAPQSGFMLLLLALGILASGTEGLVWLLASDYSGSAMARRMLVWAVGLPLVLTWLQLAARRSGYYEISFGSAVLAISFIVVYTGLIIRNAKLLNHRDVEIATHQDQLETLVAQRTAALESSQDQLRRSERLAAIGTLAAGVAHEINNPLNAILMTAEYTRDFPEDVDLASSLSEIVKETQRCSQIVRSILRFSQQEEVPKTDHDLNQIVQRVFELSYSYLPLNGVDLNLSLAPKGCQVRVNAVQIEQVLLNLVKNAVEAGSRPLAVKVSTQKNGESVLLQVADNGPGIDAAHLNRIFDPFFSTKTNRGGTGLGLTLSHSIIVDHGGTISAASQPGKGTTFTIKLPCALMS